MIVQGVVSVCFWEYSINVRNSPGSTKLTPRLETDPALGVGCRKSDITLLVTEAKSHVKFLVDAYGVPMGPSHPGSELTAKVPWPYQPIEGFKRKTRPTRGRRG